MNDHRRHTDEEIDEILAIRAHLPFAEQIEEQFGVIPVYGTILGIDPALDGPVVAMRTDEVVRWAPVGAPVPLQGNYQMMTLD